MFELVVVKLLKKLWRLGGRFEVIFLILILMCIKLKFDLKVMKLFKNNKIFFLIGL